MSANGSNWADLAEGFGVPRENRAWFARAIESAIENYQEMARPKGHPDSDAETARRMRKVAQAAVSGSSRRVEETLAGLSAEQIRKITCDNAAKFYNLTN